MQKGYNISKKKGEKRLINWELYKIRRREE